MKRQRMTWLLCSMLVWLLSSCEEEIVWNEEISVDDIALYVKTGDLTAIGGNSVTIKGSIDASVIGDVEEYGVQYSTDYMSDVYPSDPNEGILVPAVGDKNDFTVNLTGLNYKTTYYYRTYVKTGDSSYFFGKRKNFITLPVNVSIIEPAAPVIAVDASNYTIGVSGDLGIDGKLGNLNCEFGVCWKLVDVPFAEPALNEEGTENYGNWGSSSYQYSINASRWQEDANAIYALRSYFKVNIDGVEDIIYSNTQFVARTSVKQISEVLESANDVTGTGVTFQAVAVNFGEENIVEKGFCYSQTNSSPEYTENQVIDVTSSVRELIVASIQGLDVNQYYYIRAYCKNEAGEVVYSPTHIYGAYWSAIKLTDPVVQVSETENRFTVTSSLDDLYGVLDDQSSYEVGFCWKEVGTNYSDPVLGNDGVKSSSSWIESSVFNQDIYASEWSTSVDCIYAVRAYFKMTVDGEEKVVYSSTAYAVKTTEPILSPFSVVSVNGNDVTFRVLAFNLDGMEVTEKGYCYSQTNSIPTLETDTKVVAATEGNLIEATIKGLDITDNKFYYIRPYYVAGGVTYYGDVQIYGTRLAGIYTLSDLIAFRDARKNNEDVSWWKNENNEITLYADIDMSSVANWTPISTLYSGEVFNGNNKTLRNLKITAVDTEGYYDIGFIASNSGTVKSLNIGEGSSIVFTYEGNSTLSIGAICGNNDGSVVDCTSAATLDIESQSNTTTLYIGGLVGRGVAQMEKCTHKGAVSGQSTNAYLGGIIGFSNAHSAITNCVNTGSVGKGVQCEAIGGIVGYAYQTSILSCSNSGSVTAHGETHYVGGIVGHCDGYYNNEYGLIDQCSNSGEITGGDQYVGGIVGLLDGGITNCTNSGAVTTSATNVGSICGQVGSSFNVFENNQNNGTVNGGEGTLIGTDKRPPLVSDVEFSSLTSTTVVLSARILDMGGGTLQEAGFYYSTRDGSYYDNRVAGVVDGDVITVTLETLEPGTKYFVWAFVRNNFNTVRSSSSVSFTTPTSDN